MRAWAYEYSYYVTTDGAATDNHRSSALVSTRIIFTGDQF